MLQVQRKIHIMEQFIAAANVWLATHTLVPSRQRGAIAGLVPQLTQDALSASPPVVAISGPPGTGKSTLAYACAAALESENLNVIVLSLDDYYLPAADRHKIARSEHALFAVRGVPGTHDVEMLAAHLSALLDPDHPEIALPRFDKSVDDRLPETRVVEKGFKPECIFVEGWIAGAPPQAGASLLGAVNEFEASQDADGEWRHKVNAYLWDYHEILDPLLGARWHMRAPDWDSVIDWRWLQEQSGHQQRFRSREEVASFLDHFQRLCLHMHTGCRQWADTVIQLDIDHMPSIEKAS